MRPSKTGKAAVKRRRKGSSLLRGKSLQNGIVVFSLSAWPALADTLIYNFGDPTPDDGVYAPVNGDWSLGNPNEWFDETTVSPGPRGFANGDNVIFRQDIPGPAVAVWLRDSVEVGDIRFESGTFSIYNSTPVISSLAGTISRITAAAGATGAIRAQISGQFHVLVQGTLSLFTAGDGIDRIDVESGGRLTLGPETGDTITVADGVTNHGTMHVGSARHGVLKLKADLVNHGVLDLYDASVIGSLTNAGVIASTGPGTSTVTGDLILRDAGSVGGGIITVMGRLVNERTAPLTLASLRGVHVGSILNRADLIVDRDFSGALTNAGRMQVLANVGGRVVSSGETTLGAAGATEVQLQAGLDVTGGETRIAGPVRVSDAAVLPSGMVMSVQAGGKLLLDSGDLLAAGVLRNDGTLNIASGRYLTADQVIVGRGGTATVAGTVDALVDVHNGGALALDGAVLTGRLKNAGRVSGGATGRVELRDGVENTAAGEVTLGSASHLAQITGTVRNDGDMTLYAHAGDVSNNGQMVLAGSVASLTNRQNLKIAAGDRLTVRGAAVNDGTMTVAGTLTGKVTNNTGAAFALTGGRIVGVLENSGQAQLAGRIDGGVTNLSGGRAEVTGALATNIDNRGGATLTIGAAGALTGNVTNSTGAAFALTGGRIAGALENGGQAQLAGRIDGGMVNLSGGRAEVTGALAANIDNRGGATLTMGAAGALTGTIHNGADATLIGGGMVNGAVLNDGEMRLATDMQVAGNVTNNGLLTQSINDTRLDVTGTFYQNGDITTGGFSDMTISARRLTLGGMSKIGAGVNFVGELVLDGDISFEGDQTLHDNVTVASGRKLTVSTRLDGLGTADLTNNGTTQINRGGAVAGLDRLVNNGALTVDAGGLLQGRVIENRLDAALTSAGTIDGALFNAGRASLSGIVTGALVNAGTLSAARNLTIGGVWTNDGKASLTGGTTRGAGVMNNGVLTVDRGAALANTGDLLNQGSLTVSGGTVSGRIDNRGTARLQGAFGGTIANDGTMTITGDMTGTVIENSRMLTLDDESNLTAALVNSGTVTATGAIAGDVQNRGGFGLAGSVAGNLMNEGGTVSIIGDAVIRGVVTNRNTPAVTARAVLAAPGGRALLQVNADHRLTVTGGVVNETGAAARVAGTLATNLVNRGDLDLTGRIAGSLTTLGTARLAGRIAGDLTYAAGTMALTGDLEVGGRLNLQQDFALGAGRMLAAAAVAVGKDTQLAVAGTVRGAIRNEGEINLDRSGRIDSLVNAADARLTAAGGRIDGKLANDGIVDMRDDRGDSVLRVGGLEGRGTYALEIDLDRSDSAYGGDRIEVRGGAAKGDFVIDMKILKEPRGRAFSASITLIDADERYALANDYTYQARNLPAATEKIIYGVGKTGSGDLVLSVGPNGAIGGITGNIVLTQSLIGSVVNRPTSPYVTGYALADGDSPCAPGAWARATGGRADASGSSATSAYSVQSEISASYRGLQFGGDLACFDGRFHGWNMAFGVIGGVNEGSTRQPVYVLDFIDGRWTQTPRLGSTNTADFRQIYGGLYATATRDRISADLQIRREKTAFSLTNTSAIENSEGLGLTDGKFDSRATTLSGSVSYALPLPQQGWQVVPTAGFAFSNTSTDPVTFDDGTRLIIQDSKTRVGFLGTTIARGQVLKSGVEAVNIYATGTAYKDFAGGTGSEFVSYHEDGSVNQRESLVSDNLGLYGELALGASYTRVLQPGRSGRPKQISASFRLDGRTGESLDSYGITAQMRLQF